MAFSSADWTIDYALKTVTNNDSGTGNNLPSALGNYTKVGPALEFFQYLATEFASSGQMDDTYPIQSDTPTVFKWLNGWTFGNANDFKYLNGGSFEDPLGSGTATADSLWANLYLIGGQTKGTLVYMIQNEAEVTPWWISSDGTSAGNIDILVLVKDTGSWIQSEDTGGILTDGGVWMYAREFGDQFDHNFVDLSGGGRNPVGINTSADGSNNSGELYITVVSSTGFDVGNFAKDNVTSAVGKIAKVVGNDIYLNAVRGGTFGNNAVTEYIEREAVTSGATSTISSVTNTVAGYTNIKHAFVQRNFTGGTTATGPFVFGETITQTTSGATFIFVAEVANVLYVEDLAGVPDGTNLLTGGTSGATYTPTATAAATSVDQDLNNGNGVQPYNMFLGEATRSPVEIYEWTKYINRYGSTGATYTLNGDDGQEYRSANEGTYAEVKTAPLGTLAGTTFYGARGVWLAAYTLADFVLIDANETEQAPPNYQKVDVSHASLIGTYIFIAEISGGLIIKNQYTISSATTTTLTATGSMDINKTPQSGSFRVADTIYAYTSFSGAVFSGVTPDPSAETGDFYVPLMDLLADATNELSDNIIYNAPISVRTSVRKYGFKPYDVDTSFGASGLAFSPILTVDPQAT